MQQLEKIKLTLKKDQNIDWNKVIEEAEAHKVMLLVYSGINRSEVLDIMDENTFDTIKKSVIKSSVTQVIHIKNVASILKIFKKAKIPMIVLKGLVVRYYYPIPDLRTMCDADVFIHKEDLEKVTALMILSDFRKFRKNDNNSNHIVFYKGNTIFEVNCTLIDDKLFKGYKSYESKLWENTMEIEIGGVKALSLGLEDLAVHLCTHMAGRFINNGFGVRQLTDFVVLVEKKGKEIDWTSFINKSKEAGVYKFSMAIFDICNRLFNMDIPEEIKKENKLRSNYIEQLIQDIFDSGVHGKRNKDKVFANEFAFDQGEGAADGSISIIKKIFKLLFPPISEMSDKYNYAKKLIILAPIAWIHHLIEGILNKEYSFKSKLKMATSTLYMANKRNRLLRELEL